MAWIGWLWDILKAIFGNKDSNTAERQAGEELGTAKTVAAGNEKELDNAQKAVDASRAAGAADDAGGVRDQKPGDRPWSPDGLG